MERIFDSYTPGGKRVFIKVWFEGSRIVGFQPLDDGTLTHEPWSCYNLNMEKETKSNNFTIEYDETGKIVGDGPLLPIARSRKSGGSPKKKGTIGIVKFDERIPDEAAAIAFTEEAIWGDTPVCGHCQSTNTRRTKSGRPMSHCCRDCRRYFSIRTNTVMAGTNLPVRVWLLAIRYMLTGRKGISALQLAKELDIWYEAAWFLEHRIREAMEYETRKMKGIVELDEVWIGGKWAKMQGYRKAEFYGINPESPWLVNKELVLGLLERETGRVEAYHIPDRSSESILPIIMDRVERGSTIWTDGYVVYEALSSMGYHHESVNHSEKEYVNESGATTNTIEGFWALPKRGYSGIFHRMSPKHLQRYMREFAYRYTAGQGNDFDAIARVLVNMSGKRLTYEQLTAKKGK